MKIYRIRWRPKSIESVCIGGDLLFKASNLETAVQNADWILNNMFHRLNTEFPDAGYQAGWELLLAQEEEAKP